ncbi:hypothetical protein COO60DRAFT_446490 [Scenedesmus sp. NREL 46B-D3]|nr:hypothetical protein COO60DRAFT_446490 [Scenedesmus sp. NREL 46B-D3]
MQNTVQSAALLLPARLQCCCLSQCSARVMPTAHPKECMHEAACCAACKHRCTPTVRCSAAGVAGIVDLVGTANYQLLVYTQKYRTTPNHVVSTNWCTLQVYLCHAHMAY